MPRPSDMLARLDMATRKFQPDVDARWLDLMASAVTVQDYKQHLVRVYGFEAPLENALSFTPRLVIADRKRSTLVVQDLIALGVKPTIATALPHCLQIAPCSDPAEALGWKYVVERPTLLHAAVKRNLLARIPETASACAYLSACDGVASARWHKLGMLLDDVAARHAATERIIDAAYSAFACMYAWYQRDPGDAARS